jgi:putative CocE/NonD family hydrolase
MDEYVEPGTNFAQPLRAEWYRHQPISDWIDFLKEAAPYFADHLTHVDDGEYWERANVNCHAESVSVPMLHISSWYDIFAEGAPNAYRSIRDRSHFPKARANQRLIMGPWAHLLPYDVPNSRGTGEIDFGDAALIDLRATLLDWFDYWLKDIDTGIMAGPPVTVFTMGENRWQQLADWPPPTATDVRWFLHSGGNANSVHGDGSLSTVPPNGEPPDRYTYDPNEPVPTLGGANLTLPLGVIDQRPVEERRDVLVFTSEPLATPLEVTGPVCVNLWASSSASDTDFTAKLVDVHPDGYAQNLLDGIIRARYRDSATQPSLLKPDAIERYTIDLWATSNVFLPGHHIRVEISSSNFPRFDRNPNTGRPIATETECVPADQQIFHDVEHPSHITLPVIPR